MSIIVHKIFIMIFVFNLIMNNHANQNSQFKL
jgi:hypothetical protein